MISTSSKSKHFKTVKVNILLNFKKMTMLMKLKTYKKFKKEISKKFKIILSINMKQNNLLIYKNYLTKNKSKLT
jgi:hypothetical protein